MRCVYEESFDTSRNSVDVDTLMHRDVDEDEEATQRPLQARDYGIEVDFSDLSDVEREV